jgi:hypothetical protein
LSLGLSRQARKRVSLGFGDRWLAGGVSAESSWGVIWGLQWAGRANDYMQA